MTEKISRMPKALNYMEHVADFGNVVPSPMNPNQVFIQFMVTKPEPIIKGKTDHNDSNQVSIQVGMETELQHACTIIIPKAQLIELKESLDDLLEKIKP